MSIDSRSNVKIPENLAELCAESAQAKELGQLQTRVQALDTLLCYLSRRLGSGLNASGGLNLADFQHYQRLVQDQVEGILIYQKAAQHWFSCNKQEAKRLLDRAGASHRQLCATLRQQCGKLAQKIDNINLTFKLQNSERQGSYATGNTGFMFDLRA